MNIEDIKVGNRYVIDTAPLIASPQSTGSTFIGTAHHSNGRQMYVHPDNLGNSPLYINPSWFIRPVRQGE